MLDFLLEFLRDLYIWINFVAFWVVCFDKWKRGRYEDWFWFVTYAFGGVGAALACFLVRHRTRSGAAYRVLKFALVQFVLFKLLL